MLLTIEQILGIIMAGFFTVLLLSLSILLLSGKGAGFILDYEKSTIKSRLAQKYEKKLCKTLGVLILALSFCVCGVCLAFVFDVYVLKWIFIILCAVDAVGGIVYVYASPKMRMVMFLAKKLNEEPAYFDKIEKKADKETEEK